MSEKQGLVRLLADRGLRPVDLARSLKVNKSSITLWTLRRVPAERVLEVEKLTGISRHDLRPDIYPAPEQAGAA